MDEASISLFRLVWLKYWRGTGDGGRWMTIQTLIKCPKCGSVNIDYSKHPDLKCLNCGHRFKEPTE